MRKFLKFVYAFMVPLFVLGNHSNDMRCFYFLIYIISFFPRFGCYILIDGCSYLSVFFEWAFTLHAILCFAGASFLTSVLTTILEKLLEKLFILCVFCVCVWLEKGGSGDYRIKKIYLCVFFFIILYNFYYFYIINIFILYKNKKNYFFFFIYGKKVFC